MNEILNAMTIDVEDYYQVSASSPLYGMRIGIEMKSRVERNTHKILDLLDRYKTKATFFVLGWVAERCPKMIRSIYRTRP